MTNRQWKTWSLEKAWDWLVKSIGRNQKTRYWNHFENCDARCAGKSYSDPKLNVFRVKSCGRWCSPMTWDTTMSAFIEVKGKNEQCRQGVARRTTNSPPDENLRKKTATTWESHEDWRLLRNTHSWNSEHVLDHKKSQWIWTNSEYTNHAIQ